MKKKKKPNTFTIQFNEELPHHRRAIEMLNQQGNKKAEYIAQALCGFEGFSSFADNITLEKTIERIVDLKLAELGLTKNQPDTEEMRDIADSFLSAFSS